MRHEVSAFSKGAYSAMRVALREGDRARDSRDIVGQTRAWKLFLLLPRLLLHRPPRGGLVPKSRLRERFSLFATGHWFELFDHSQVCADQPAVASRRRRDRVMTRNEGRTERRLWSKWVNGLQAAMLLKERR